MAELLLPERDREALAVQMYREGHFGINEDPGDYIKLKSGRMSPHYFNVRTGLSNPTTRSMVANTMARLTLYLTDADDYKNLVEHYEHFVGSPEAMTSYAALIADSAGMSLLQPRVDLEKISGNKDPILGRYVDGDRVAAFDDVITDGATKIEVVTALGKHGLNVTDYYVVLDREEGGAAEVAAATGLVVTPVLGLANTVRILRAAGEISTTQFDNVVEYMSQHGDPGTVDELVA